MDDCFDIIYDALSSYFVFDGSSVQVRWEGNKPLKFYVEFWDDDEISCHYIQVTCFLDKDYKDIFYAVGHVRHYLNEDGDYKTSDISSDNLKIVLNACIKTVEDYFYYLNEEED
jgi:hypothetical protein